MGMPVARVGDNTAHGTPLNPGPGSINVLIGGRPAWRVGVDLHLCPLVTGGVPHATGVVLVGSSSVLINGAFAVRVNDQIVENAPPNSIVSGDTTVLIG
jgi:uncharacterized Zn-binding protein involved in type VI secretion